VATSLILLAGDLRAQKKYTDARAAAEESAAIYQHHPDLVGRLAYGSPFLTLGQILLDLGDGPAGNALADQLIQQAEKADSDVQRADAYAAVIPLLAANNRQEQAGELGRKLLALPSPNTSSLNAAAWALATNPNVAHGDAAVAVELAKKAVELPVPGPASGKRQSTICKNRCTCVMAATPSTGSFSQWPTGKWATKTKPALGSKNPSSGWTRTNLPTRNWCDFARKQVICSASQKL
jgi:hypothetical protein